MHKQVFFGVERVIAWAQSNMVRAIVLAFALVSAQDIFLEKVPSWVVLTSDEAANLILPLVTLTDDEAANLDCKGLCCNCKSGAECATGFCFLVQTGQLTFKCVQRGSTPCYFPPAPDRKVR